MKVKKILVSQPRPTTEKSPYFDIAAKFGVEIVFRPFFKIEGLTSREFRQNKVQFLDHTAVIFTARTAIDHYFRLMKELRFDVPDTMKYFCINESVALYLQKYIIYRKRKISFSENGRVEGLLPLLQKHSKENFLFPVGEGGDSKEEILRKAGVQFQEAVIYRSVHNNFAPDEDRNYDMFVFFTPVGVKAFVENFPNYKNGDAVIGAIGDKTIEELHRSGLDVDVTTSPKIPSITGAIEKYLEDGTTTSVKRKVTTEKKNTSVKKEPAKKSVAKKTASKTDAIVADKKPEAQKKAKAATKNTATETAANKVAKTTDSKVTKKKSTSAKTTEKKESTTVKKATSAKKTNVATGTTTKAISTAKKATTKKTTAGTKK